MHADYSDIRSRIQEEPSWFDEFAVPRYGPFSPDAMGNVYAREAVLILSACQGCGRHFRLAMSHPYYKGDLDLATAICNRSLHYGDPPNVGCCATGPTMGVVELEVLEYWWRILGRGGWVREASFEVGVVPIADDPRYEAYYDRDRNPEYGLSAGAIPREPSGAIFDELSTELMARYPAVTQEATNAALRISGRLTAPEQTSTWQLATSPMGQHGQAGRPFPKNSLGRRPFTARVLAPAVSHCRKNAGRKSSRLSATTPPTPLRKAALLAASAADDGNNVRSISRSKSFLGTKARSSLDWRVA